MGWWSEHSILRGSKAIMGVNYVQRVLRLHHAGPWGLMAGVTEKSNRRVISVLWRRPKTRCWSERAPLLQLVNSFTAEWCVCRDILVRRLCPRTVWHQIRHYSVTLLWTYWDLVSQKHFFEFLISEPNRSSVKVWSSLTFKWILKLFSSKTIKSNIQSLMLKVFYFYFINTVFKIFFAWAESVNFHVIPFKWTFTKVFYC